MKWYYQQLGGHTHVRVYMNGALLGTLVFRVDEFEDVMSWNLGNNVEFIEGAKA